MKTLSKAVILLLCSAMLADNTQAINLVKKTKAVQQQHLQVIATAKHKHQEKAQIHKKQVVKAKTEVKAKVQNKVQSKANVQKTEQNPQQKDWNSMLSVVNPNEYMSSQMSALEEQQVNKQFEEPVSDDDPVTKDVPHSVVEQPKEHAKTQQASQPIQKAQAGATTELDQQSKIAKILASPLSIAEQGNQIKNLVDPSLGGMAPTGNDIMIGTKAENTNAVKQQLSAKDEEDKKRKIAEVLGSDLPLKDQQEKIEQIDESFKYPSQATTKAALVQQRAVSILSSQQEMVEKSVEQEIAVQKQKAEIEKQVEKLGDEVEQFSETFDPQHYDNAVDIQLALKKKGCSDGDKLLQVHAEELFRKGFKKFPQVAENQYVQDQLTYLEGAEDNLNGNFLNRKLMEAYLATGSEVADKLTSQYPEVWTNPMK